MNVARRGFFIGGTAFGALGAFAYILPGLPGADKPTLEKEGLRRCSIRLRRKRYGKDSDNVKNSTSEGERQSRRTSRPV